MIRYSLRAIAFSGWVFLIFTGTLQADTPQTPSIEEIRKTCNLLTNARITQYNPPGIFQGSVELPARKKAVSRYVKYLCDDLEAVLSNGAPFADVERGKLKDLELMKASFLTKAEHPVNKVGTLKKIAFLWNGFRSDDRLDYDLDSLTAREPGVATETSLFWRPSDGKKKLSARFDQLAKAKKIKFDPTSMVALFSSISQDGSGPKLRAKDLNLDDEWNVKWGDEIHSDVMGSRLFAALGFDVDHPYYSGRNHLTLVFPNDKITMTTEKMLAEIWDVYGVNIQPWISEQGTIDDAMILHQAQLSPFKGLEFVRFVECAMEARPDRVKRLGSFLPNDFDHPTDQTLRGSLAAHLLIHDWDTREENTLLTVVHAGNSKYSLSGVFSDLGTSFGVKVHFGFKPDFRATLVNEFDWSLFEKHTPKRAVFNQKMNHFFRAYKEAKPEDLQWMAAQVAQLDADDLDAIVGPAGLPDEVAQLYFQKLASRRADLLLAFKIKDLTPINYHRELTLVSSDGKTRVKNGQLVAEPDPAAHPEGFLNEKGRRRNYGGNKP